VGTTEDRGCLRKRINQPSVPGGYDLVVSSRARALIARYPEPLTNVGEPDQPGIALLADRPLLNNQPTAYVCRQFVCKLPTTSAEDLAIQLADH